MAAQPSPIRPLSTARGAPRKPMACATRVTLFEREIRERLSPSGIEILLDAAEVLSEGQREELDGGRVRFNGSTMLTIDLGRVHAALREPCDPVLAARAAAFLAQDARVARRVRAIAQAEARRLAGAAVTLVPAEPKVRARGTIIHIDLDIEAALP
ncbi:MAG TPA: hypothetical protein VGQ83_39435 [Polyangia bacterium]|jgi:hypothetical protein